MGVGQWSFCQANGNFLKIGLNGGHWLAGLGSSEEAWGPKELVDETGMACVNQMLIFVRKKLDLEGLRSAMPKNLSTHFDAIVQLILN